MQSFAPIASGLTIEQITVAVAILVTGVMLLIGFAVLSSRDAKQRARRLDRAKLGSDEKGGASRKGGTAQVSVKRSQANSSIKVFDRLIKALLPNPAKLRLRLERTGYKISIGKYIVATLLTMGAAGLTIHLSLTSAGTGSTYTPTALRATDSMLNPEGLRLSWVGNAIGGTVQIVDDAAVFAPRPNHTGPASFDYTLADINGATATETLVIPPESGIVALKPVFAALGGFMIGLGLPHLVVGFLGRRRQKQFVAIFPEAIDLIVRGLKSGLPVTESIKVVASEMARPVSEEFRLIADQIKFGSSLNDSLWSVAPRINLAEYRFFAITLGIQQETGGNLAETLENLSGVLRRRKQMKLKIKAFSSEAKASAYIIGSLPFMMFLIINTINPAYASKLFTDPRGLVMIGVGLLSFLVGALVMAKMIRFDI